jgi:ornithine carbamoyltransferase
MEVITEVFESPASIALNKGENRVHTIRTLMGTTLGN